MTNIWLFKYFRMSSLRVEHRKKDLGNQMQIGFRPKSLHRFDDVGDQP